MKILPNISSVIRWRRRLPPRRSVGFVPTMGALHEGHLSLIRKSRQENDRTLVSVFVNPLQFGPTEDFNRYPRTWRSDSGFLIKEKVDVVFLPAANAMYPRGFSTLVSVSSFTKTLCAAPTSRGPDHFVGVATVVAKLFHLVQPTRAYFGLKDFQQVRVIEQMNKDLNIGVEIVRCPTVRDSDGLALSSRNAYLSAHQRETASRFPLALQYGRKLLTSTQKMRPSDVLRKVKSVLLAEPGIQIEYIELVHPETLTPVSEVRRPVLLAGAVRVGATRLIDNILVK